MNYKVIITGPVGSGKTTAVNSLTDKDAVLTDAVVSDSDQITKKRKRTTTVAMDYDVVRLNDEHMVHVYGTPGQERFDFMWDILSQGAHGVILLLDNTRNYPFRDLKYYINHFSKLIKASRLIIGITRFDLKKEPPISAYHHWLTTLGIEAEIIPIDAREKADVTTLFHKLLDIPNPNKDDDVKKPDNDINTKEKLDKKEIKETTAIETETAKPIDIPSSEDEPHTIPPEDTITFNETALAEVTKFDNVTGATITNSMGELLHSTIKSDELNEFIAFLSGVTPEIENILNRGKIHRIMLRSPRDENLTIFVEKERSLGVSSNRRKSVQALSQQIEDMLQWM